MIQADRFFTEEQNGLAQDWTADTLFFNPPYGAGLIGPMIAKFLEELPRINQSIVLVNSSTNVEWYQALVRCKDRMLLPGHRIQFWTAEGLPTDPASREAYQTKPKGNNRFAQTLFYFGPNVDRFDALAADLGVSLKTFSVGKTNDLQKAPESLSPVPPEPVFCSSNDQPTEKKSVNLALQLIDALSEEVDRLKAEGVAAASQYLNEQAKGDRTYYLLRWVVRGQVKSKSLKPSEVSEVRSRIARRNEAQSLECRISEIHKIIQKLEVKY